MTPILYGKAGFSDSYQRYMMCKEFGWDYYTYEKQPARFINELLLIMNQVNQKQKRDQDAQERKTRRR